MHRHRTRHDNRCGTRRSTPRPMGPGRDRCTTEDALGFLNSINASDVDRADINDRAQRGGSHPRNPLKRKADMSDTSTPLPGVPFSWPLEQSSAGQPWQLRIVVADPDQFDCVPGPPTPVADQIGYRHRRGNVIEGHVAQPDTEMHVL